MTDGSAALLRSEVRSRTSKFLLQATKHLPVRFEAENPSGNPLAVRHTNAPDNTADVWDSRRRQGKCTQPKSEEQHGQTRV